MYSAPLLHLKPPVNPTRILTSLLYCGQSVRTFPGSGITPARNLAVSTRVHSLVRHSSSYNLTFNDEDFYVDLERLLDILPEEMRRRVTEHPERRFLIEVVMDLGRKPLARFPSGDFVLSDHPITAEDIQRATSQVSWCFLFFLFLFPFWARTFRVMLFWVFRFWSFVLVSGHRMSLICRVDLALLRGQFLSLAFFLHFQFYTDFIIDYKLLFYSGH